MGNSMRQVRSNTSDEVHTFNQVKDGHRKNRKLGAVGCDTGSYVWVRLKAEADLLIFKREAGGWETGGGGSLIRGSGHDSDKRPGEISYGDQSNTCHGPHELHSTQTRCGSRKSRVPAQEGGGCPLPLSPFVLLQPWMHTEQVNQHLQRSCVL